MKSNLLTSGRTAVCLRAYRGLSYSPLLIGFATIFISTSALAQSGQTESKGDWSSALPYYNRANKYLGDSRYDDAVKDFNEAIARYPGDPDFYTNLGIALRKLGRYADAEQAYRKAIALNPKDWVPWSDLANVYLKQDKLKETVATFEEVLKHDPPESEKTAIKKDIADIKKIMAMQGTATTGEAAKPEVTPAWQPPVNPAQSNSMADGLKHSHLHHGRSLSVKDAQAVYKNAPGADRAALGGRAAETPKKNGAAAQARDSDWGYTNK